MNNDSHLSSKLAFPFVVQYLHTSSTPPQTNIDSSDSALSFRVHNYNILTSVLIANDKLVKTIMPVVLVLQFPDFIQRLAFLLPGSLIPHRNPSNHQHRRPSLVIA